MSSTACQNYRSVHRRELIRAGSLSLFGLTLPQYLAGAEAKKIDKPTFGRAKACILLFMWGGPAQQDTWDMKPEAPEEYRGEFKPIATKVPGIHICEHFPMLAQRTDKLTIVRSMTHTNVDHTSATHYMLTGEPPPAVTEKLVQWPHMGSVLAKLGRGSGSLPPFVSMRPKLENDVPRFVEQSQGQFAGWLGSIYDPMTIDHNPNAADYRIDGLKLSPEISVSRLRVRTDLLAQLRQQLDQNHQGISALHANQRRAFDLLTSSAEQQGAFDLHLEPASLRERYGMNPHGQSVLQARRLIERGVPLVTVFWPNDGIKNVSVYWDTHSKNFIDLRERLMPVADKAFSALLDDLSERGLLDETLVVWTGEFGRTPRVGQRNSDAGAGRDGRDHWPGVFTSVVAGGGFKGGHVYGKSDRQAAYPEESPVQPRDLMATIYHALGVPNDQALTDFQGRTHFVCPGRVIDDLLV
ncbi:MAG: DUF1501 domain-containing protein [Pirellulaceae bacterium]